MVARQQETVYAVHCVSWGGWVRPLPHAQLIPAHYYSCDVTVAVMIIVAVISLALAGSSEIRYMYKGEVEYKGGSDTM